jgi:arabinose-5-phosphate isomerase
MHKGDSVPYVFENDVMSEVLITMTKKGFGATAVIDKNELLIGIITDGDLRRHMSQDLVKLSAGEVMSLNPKRIKPTMLAIEALTFMNEKAITSLLVADTNSKLCGIIHIHDLLRAGVG